MFETVAEEDQSRWRWICECPYANQCSVEDISSIKADLPALQDYEEMFEMSSICKQMTIIYSSSLSKWMIIYEHHEPPERLKTGCEVLYSEAAGWVASTSGPFSNEHIVVTWTVNCSRWSTQSWLGCDWSMDLGALVLETRYRL